MPSLRRTASSPIVRSSPYPYSSSHTASAVRARSHRKSSGTETSERRVLADIDWWKVTEGQCDPNADNAGNSLLDDIRWHAEEGSLDPASLTTVNLDVEHPVPWVSNILTDVSESLHAMPTEQLAALSISCSTPPLHGRDSSVSSLESSPEPAEFSLDVSSELDMGFLGDSMPPLPCLKRAPRFALAPSLARSFTFADAFSLHKEASSHYADFAISPLSSACSLSN